MVLLDHFFGLKFLSKSLLASKLFENLYQRMQMIDISLKYILWYDFLNDLDALDLGDFMKKLSQKAGQVEPFLS